MRRITSTDDRVLVEHEEDGPYSGVEVKYAPESTRIEVGDIILTVGVGSVDVRVAGGGHTTVRVQDVLVFSQDGPELPF